MSDIEYEEEYEFEEEYEDDLEPEIIEEEPLLTKNNEHEPEEDDENTVDVIKAIFKKKIEQDILLETPKSKDFCLEEEEYL